MKKVYKVEVDCAVCAAKMEDAVKKCEGVVSASMSFMTQKLTVEFFEGVDIESVMKKVIRACKRIERDFELFL